MTPFLASSQKCRPAPLCSSPSLRRPRHSRRPLWPAVCSSAHQSLVRPSLFFLTCCAVSLTAVASEAVSQREWASRGCYGANAAVILNASSSTGLIPVSFACTGVLWFTRHASPGLNDKAQSTGRNDICATEVKAAAAAAAIDSACSS